MKIKKYIANSMPEAMNKIKKELGAEAVILNSKEIKSGGFLGLFRQKKIEVIAALDETSPSQKPIRSKKEISPLSHPTSRMDETVLTEINHLKQILATNAMQQQHEFPPVYEHAFTYLKQQDVEEEIARQIIENVLAESSEENYSKEEMKHRLTSEIERNLIFSSGISKEKRVIQFVGPTGVGKTTTLAKVAALTMLEQNKKIAFITADTYRIAAIEQLKTYARILNVPIEVAYTLDDYQQALEKFSDYDYIFVDTAGRNFRNEQYVKELTKLIDFDRYEVETYLVLSLTAKATDIITTYDQFQQIPIEKVIFT